MLAALVSPSPLIAANTAYWDTGPLTAGAQDGNGTFAPGSNSFVIDPVAGTTPYAPVNGDTLTFGNGTPLDPTAYVVALSNGGSLLNYGDSTVTPGALTFAKNYTLAPTAAGDGLAIGTVNVQQGVTATIPAMIGTLSTATQNWTLRPGSTLNLSGGGLIQNLVTSGTNSAAVINITAGTYATGANAAGSATTAAFTPAYTRPSFGTSTSILTVNQSGGTVSGGFAVGNGTSSGLANNTYNLTGGSFVNRNNDSFIGEGTSGNTAGTAAVNVYAGASITDFTNNNILIGGRGDPARYLGNGALNVLGGTVNLTGGNGNGAIFLAYDGLNSATATASALNIGSGSVVTGTSGSIRFGYAPAGVPVAYAAGTSATLNLTGGALYVGAGGLFAYANPTLAVGVNLGGGTVGAVANWSSALPITLTGTNGNTTFTAADNSATPVPRNISLTGGISGGGGILKTGAGTLNLSGPNTFQGGTTVAGGTLVVSTVLGTLGTGDVLVSPDTAAAGAILELDANTDLLPTQSLTLADNGPSSLATVFLNFTGSDTIRALTVNGVPLSPGVYSSTNRSFLTGPGSLTVAAVPEPAGITLVVLSSTYLARCRRRRV